VIVSWHVAAKLLIVSWMSKVDYQNKVLPKSILWNIYNLKTCFYFYIFQHVIYSCEGKAEFLASFLWSSVSHDPSEIILICWFGHRAGPHCIFNSFPKSHRNSMVSIFFVPESTNVLFHITVNIIVSHARTVNIYMSLTAPYVGCSYIYTVK